MTSTSDPAAAPRNGAPTLYLIDGTAYIHRAYHAIRGLTNSKGLPTNAVFGFTRMLIKLMAERRPEYAAMLFDAKGPTFRHERYEAYKANRPPMAEEMAVQIPLIKRVTRGFNLPLVEMAGFEADDLIGTLARQAQEKGFFVVMVTGDKDFMQLVTDTAVIWDPMKEKTVDRTAVRAAMGIDPGQVVDVMGLAGDSSDNIPGVPGIGPKTAQNLIQSFGSLEALYADLDKLSAKKQQEKLSQYREQAFLSRELATIETRAPLAFDPQEYRLRGPDNAALAGLFKELEFRQLQKDYPQGADHTRKDYRLVLDEEALDSLVARLEKAGRVALDTETTSQYPMQARLVGLSFAVQPDQGFYIPCGHDYPGVPPQLALKTVLARLKPLLENPAVPKVGQNIKYDWMVLARHGVRLAGVVFDTMLASYLINPSKRAHSLDQIALDFLDYKTVSYAEVTGTGKNAINFSQVPLDQAAAYASEDADVTLQACGVLQPQLAEIGLTELFETVEMPLVAVLVKMEMAGIRVDEARLRALSKDFEHQLELLEREIYAQAGETFNIKSSQQLGAILFEKLKLPTQKKTKKKTGYSTDVEVLTALAVHHELPALILKHRTLAKLKSTYTDSLLELVNRETGRIHTSFNQTVAATGRLSSSDPNLQNIPIRTEEGREIRSAFIPRAGWQLVSADYSQIELRILAHVSQDEILIKAFSEGEDIHTRTATEVFEVLPNFITPDLRRQAKVINFGIIYGMSPFSLAKELNISQKMAKTYIEHYFARYSGVKAYIDRTIAEAAVSGRTSTLLGRIRLLPEIHSKNQVVRGFAERMAINTPIQGTAADLIKLAMIRVDAALAERKLKSAMLLSVHDEIVFEVPPEEMDTVRAVVQAEMEGVWDLSVPLKVNISHGGNWTEAH